jgi:hypothetical protein
MYAILGLLSAAFQHLVREVLLLHELKQKTRPLGPGKRGPCGFLDEPSDAIDSANSARMVATLLSPPECFAYPTNEPSGVMGVFGKNAIGIGTTFRDSAVRTLAGGAARRSPCFNAPPIR